MKEFLTEYKTLLEIGIETERGVVEFDLKCFTCDAPAREFLKCIKGHTGYHSCGRCTIESQRHDKTMTFEDTNCILRTDTKFSEFSYPGHQHRKSILIEYDVPCISKFVLDYMHLVCLGVVRRMLNHLHNGPRICKLSQQQLTIISDRLDSLRNQLPSEFPRQPRSLKHLKRWKATEYKQFLLYTGISTKKCCLQRSLSTFLKSCCFNFSFAVF